MNTLHRCLLTVHLLSIHACNSMEPLSHEAEKEFDRIFPLFVSLHNNNAEQPALLTDESRIQIEHIARIATAQPHQIKEVVSQCAAQNNLNSPHTFKTNI